MCSTARYSSKAELDAREDKWYEGQAGGSETGGLVSELSGSARSARTASSTATTSRDSRPESLPRLNTMPPAVTAASSPKAKSPKIAPPPTSQEVVAEEMTLVRSKMQAGRDETERMIEQLMLAHEESRTEQRALTLELASMSADAGRKLLIKVLLRIGKMYLAIAWTAWYGNTAAENKAQMLVESEVLKKELELLRARVAAAELDVATRVSAAADYALRHASKSQRFLLLKVFSRLVGDLAREALLVWKDAYLEFRRKYALMLKILSRLAMQQLAKGWAKWYRETFLAAGATLDETIAEVRFELVRAKDAHAKAERKLERIVSELTERALANASPYQRTLMLKILGKCCTVLLRYGFKKLVDKVRFFKTAKQLMAMILNRLCNAQLNYGFRRWIMVALKDKDSAHSLALGRIRGQLDALKAHKGLSQQRIAEFEAVVLKMRDSVTLRHAAISQITQGADEVDLEIRSLMAECSCDGKSDGEIAPRETQKNAALDRVVSRDGGARGELTSGGGGEQRSRERRPSSVDSNTRAHLLVFLQNLEHCSPEDTCFGALAAHPGFQRHKSWLKKSVVLGDEQLAAAIRAYEFTLDTQDFVDTLGLIANLSLS